MATLLPSLSSDDEEDDVINDGTNKVKEGRRNKTYLNTTGTRRRRRNDDQQRVQHDDDDDEDNVNNDDDDDDDGMCSSDDEMDESLEFGGILGEDGGLSGASSLLSSSSMEVGWSYQTVLNRLQQQQEHQQQLTTGSTGTNTKPTTLPRMDIDSLITAKRRALLDKKKRNDVTEPVAPFNEDSARPSSSTSDTVVVDDDCHSDRRSSTREEQSKEKDSAGEGCDKISLSKSMDDGSDDDSESSDGDDDDDDIFADDVDRRNMEKDILKTRSGKDDDDDDQDEEENGKRSRRRRRGGDDDDGDDREAAQDREEMAKAAAFFDQDDEILRRTNSNNNVERMKKSEGGRVEVFAQLSLSRPLLRGVAAMGFVEPTPIQASVIPLALAGRDVCASAVTGSGKTAAFLLPILEVLIHRYRGRIRSVILTPTRELAAQCMAMMTTMAQFTNVTSCLIVGGAKNINAQAAELRNQRPDVVVATPGRLLDHVTNSPGVTLEHVEYLVLDEADRLLDLGFQDEIHELVRACPSKDRQTLLFSATMNTKVDDLVKLSLKRPVRVRIGASRTPTTMRDMDVAPRLEQEFVRVRASCEGVRREAMLLSLLSRTYTKEVIVFFDTKVTAHRIKILCGLQGIRCTELHGDLTQQRRLEALDEFRNGRVDVLLATDLAARGLDIDRIDTVINFEMPTNVDTYIHRIGRTARAGRGGKSCTLVGEGRRHLMKTIIRRAESSKKKSKKKEKEEEEEGNAEKKNKTEVQSGIIRSRTIPPSVIEHLAEKIGDMEPHVKEVLQAEAVAKMDRIAEMEVVRAQNIIEHADEIRSRPQRVWFATNKEKQATKEAAAAAATGSSSSKATMGSKEAEKRGATGTGMHRMTRKKRRAREAREAFEALKSQDRQGGGDGDEGDDNDGPPQKKKSKKDKIVDPVVTARKEKKKVEEKEKRSTELSISERAERYRLQKQDERDGPTKKGKRKDRPAVGDGSLFDEEQVTFAKPGSKKKGNDDKEETRVKSSYVFHEYDPDKKLGKKRGSKKFKSKSKFRRR